MRTEEQRTNERNLGKAIFLMAGIAALLALGATFLWTPRVPPTFWGFVNGLCPLLLLGISYWFEPGSKSRIILSSICVVWWTVGLFA